MFELVEVECDDTDFEDVCCNCKHNIRSGKVPNIECHCDIDGSWLSYLTVMGYKCEKWESEDE